MRKQEKIIKQHFQDVEAYWRKGLKDYSDLWENGLPQWVPERIHKTRLWDILQYILENTLERKEAKKVCKDHGIKVVDPVLWMPDVNDMSDELKLSKWMCYKYIKWGNKVGLWDTVVEGSGSKRMIIIVGEYYQYPDEWKGETIQRYGRRLYLNMKSRRNQILQGFGRYPRV